MRIGLTFGEAIVALKDGEKICRHGWNGKGMWLVLIKSSDYLLHLNIKHLDDILESAFRQEPLSEFLSPFICMKTADNKFVPWLANQTDILSEDWMTLPNN